jgi:hypothetical protein
MFLRNVGNHLPNDAASHRGRPQSPPTYEQHSTRRLHRTDCQLRISYKPQAKYNVRTAAISLYTNSTATKLHIFARPKTEHHTQTVNRLPLVSVSPHIFADQPCSCFCLQEIIKVRKLTLVWRFVKSVTWWGQGTCQEKQANTHARTSHTPSGRRLRQAPALRQPPLT